MTLGFENGFLTKQSVFHRIQQRDGLIKIQCSTTEAAKQSLTCYEKPFFLFRRPFFSLPALCKSFIQSVTLNAVAKNP